MAKYSRPRINILERLDEPRQALTLRSRASVLWRLAVSRKPADVAHANAVRVVASAMRTRHVNAAPLVNAAVTIDHIMVTNRAEPALQVPALDVARLSR